MNRKPVEAVCWPSKLQKGELKRKENQKKAWSVKERRKGGSEGGELKMIIKSKRSEVRNDGGMRV